MSREAVPIMNVSQNQIVKQHRDLLSARRKFLKSAISRVRAGGAKSFQAQSQGSSPTSRHHDLTEPLVPVGLEIANIALDQDVKEKPAGYIRMGTLITACEKVVSIHKLSYEKLKVAQTAMLRASAAKTGSRRLRES